MYVPCSRNDTRCNACTFALSLKHCGVFFLLLSLQGLLEVAAAGNRDALPLLRAHFDWFNGGDDLPFFLPPVGQGLPFPSTIKQTLKQNDQFQHGHEIYLIYQGIIHNTRLALSVVGQQQDLDTAEKYEEKWWLAQLAARNVSAIWARSKYPHNYEVTAIEAYTDMYQLTGDPRYLEGVDGFFEMFRDHFMHIGGTVAIKEWKFYPPGSYFLDTTGEDPHGTHGHSNCSLDINIPDPPLCPNVVADAATANGTGGRTSSEACTDCWHSTGETCGQVFWIKLSQRLHRLRPQEEKYVVEIEKTIFNGILGQIPPVTGLGPRRLPNGTVDGVEVGIRPVTTPPTHFVFLLPRGHW